MGYRLLIDAACICCKQFSQILRHQQYRFDASEMNRNRNFEYENFIFNETKTPGNQQYLCSHLWSPIGCGEWRLVGT